MRPSGAGAIGCMWIRPIPAVSRNSASDSFHRPPSHLRRLRARACGVTAHHRQRRAASIAGSRLEQGAARQRRSARLACAEPGEAQAVLAHLLQREHGCCWRCARRTCGALACSPSGAVHVSSGNGRQRRAPPSCASSAARAPASRWRGRSAVASAGVSVALEISGRGAQHRPDLAQRAAPPSGNRPGWPTRSGDVDAGVDEVDHGVVDQQAQAQLRRLRPAAARGPARCGPQSPRGRPRAVPRSGASRASAPAPPAASRAASSEAPAVRVAALAGLGQRRACASSGAAASTPPLAARACADAPG
jgi:hypothetical protein